MHALKLSEHMWTGLSGFAKPADLGQIKRVAKSGPKSTMFGRCWADAGQMMGRVGSDLEAMLTNVAELDQTRSDVGQFGAHLGQFGGDRVPNLTDVNQNLANND